MSYLEPPCEHAPDAARELGCGCVVCDDCGERTDECRKPDCTWESEHEWDDDDEFNPDEDGWEAGR